MFGVIFLGNASTPLQIGFAVAHMVLNAVHWVVATLPQKFFWDTIDFEVIPRTFGPEPGKQDEFRTGETRTLKGISNR
jgi:hypothetical protein